MASNPEIVKITRRIYSSELPPMHWGEFGYLYWCDTVRNWREAARNRNGQKSRGKSGLKSRTDSHQSRTVIRLFGTSPPLEEARFPPHLSSLTGAIVVRSG